ncbi:MAG: hypothetical protein ACK4FP_13745 [Azonexus sp.]
MAYELIWEPEGVVRRFSGNVSATEFINSVERVQGDSRYDDMHYVINDFSTVAAVSFSDETFTELAVLHYGAFVSNPNCRVVFVTTDNMLAGMVRRILQEGPVVSYQVEVFPTEREARDWLASQPQLHLMSNVMGFRLD